MLAPVDQDRNDYFQSLETLCRYMELALGGASPLRQADSPDTQCLKRDLMIVVGILVLLFVVAFVAFEFPFMDASFGKPCCNHFQAPNKLWEEFASFVRVQLHDAICASGFDRGTLCHGPTCRTQVTRPAGVLLARGGARKSPPPPPPTKAPCGSTGKKPRNWQAGLLNGESPEWIPVFRWVSSKNHKKGVPLKRQTHIDQLVGFLWSRHSMISSRCALVFRGTPNMDFGFTFGFHLAFRTIDHPKRGY